MATHFRAVLNHYLIKEERRLRAVWHPQIKHEGQWLYLHDEITVSKLAEAEDEATAYEKAIKAYREVTHETNRRNS